MEQTFDASTSPDQQIYDTVSDDSDSGSEHGVSAGRGSIVPRTTFMVRQITEQIRSLYNLSALLRRPTMSSKYIRSERKDQALIRDLDTDFIPLHEAYSTIDKRHVAEKMRQWRGPRGGADCVGAEERAADIKQFLSEQASLAGLQRECCKYEDIVWLHQRLSKANTKRREQLEYWVKHPCDPTKCNPIAEAGVEVPTRLQGQMPATRPSGIDIQPRIDIQPSKTKSVSAFSQQTFSIVPVSDVYDTMTNKRPRTLYAPTAVGRRTAASVPNPPKIDEVFPSFNCPYCGAPLDSNEMTNNRQSWKCVTVLFGAHCCISADIAPTIQTPRFPRSSPIRLYI